MDWLASLTSDNIINFQLGHDISEMVMQENFVLQYHFAGSICDLP